METLLAIAVGVGLSAACGFRVFVPLLALNLASLSGHLSLSPECAWMGSHYATIVFATATVAEVLAYYLPWVDHLLDVVATPAAVLAGTITTASVVTDISPFLKWPLALIAGGGIAGLVQGGTVLLRATSALTTAGAGNPVVAAVEVGASIIIALLALLVPLLCLALIVTLCVCAFRKAGRVFFGKRVPGTPAS